MWAGYRVLWKPEWNCAGAPIEEVMMSVEIMMCHALAKVSHGQSALFAEPQGKVGAGKASEGEPDLEN